MSEVDDQIERARATMARISEGDRGGGVRRRDRTQRTQAIGKRLTRIAIANAVILVLAVLGVFSPLGWLGALVVIALMVAATLFLSSWPAERAPTAERLVQSDLRALPAQTERWLDTQRAGLPAAAASVVDRIGVRLETLSPQLAKIDNDAPEAAEVRKLIGEQLPAFVTDYGKVPTALRAEARNGRTPDAELVDGLRLIEGEIAAMTQRLAQGDLDQLSTRGRFLEIKYKDQQE